MGQTEKKLVLIDGYGLFFRAFFAQRNLTRSDGLPVNGVYGFTRMILNILVDLNTTHIAIVFDSGKKTFRNEKYPEYKTNRPPVPKDMIEQFPIIREVADVLCIKSLEKEGYEADDIIATLVKRARAENYDETLVVSSDKDLLQLVGDRVSVFDAANKKKIDRQGVFEKWGVFPEKLLDVFSLAGDASDNIPGVPSIGGKTAVQLIDEFGDLDNLVKNVDNIKQRAKREAIKNNLDKLFLSKELITLRDDVELDATLDDLLYKNINAQKFKNFLIKMEFFSIAKQVDKYFPTAAGDGDGEQSVGGGGGKFRYKKICEIETLGDALKNIADAGENFYFNIFLKNIGDVGSAMAVAFIDVGKKFIYYLELKKEKEDLFGEREDCPLELTEVLKIMEKYALKNENVKKVSLNIKNNMRALGEHNLAMDDNFDDLPLMSYMLDCGKFSQSFSSLLGEYLQTNALVAPKNIDKNVEFWEQYEKEKDLDNIAGLDVFNFCCETMEYCFFLHDILSFRLNDNEKLLSLYKRIDKPLVAILANMEKCGIKIAVGELNNLSLFFNEKIGEAQRKIFDLAGEEFNISSPKQLSYILFDKLHIKPYEKPSKTGQYSTGADVLERLYEDGYEISDKILEYRHYQKLKNTYSDILPSLIDRRGRLRTTFLNTSVMTGRLSSANPNLQNIPIRTLDGEKMRRAFIADDGYSFIDADYSQIELRILAQYAGVKNLVLAFKNNVDIHAKTAREVFGLEEATPEARQRAKAINFSIIYGTSSFGLAKRLKVSNYEAKTYMDNYFKLYPEIPIYMENMRELARKNGFVETLFHRRCHINLNAGGIERAYLERVAINAPIQGTGADIIKLAMISVWNELKRYGDDARLLLQIHDELLIEVKDELADEVSKKIKSIMENVVSFEVPLAVNCKIGKNWGEAH
ncbi:MAG: DNA polymerase I [Rickettsiales bacterium]|jgi:DNA polymerase-1|nr:DNA polymerase I [Rickettsiales bacterium]